MCGGADSRKRVLMVRSGCRARVLTWLATRGTSPRVARRKTTEYAIWREGFRFLFYPLLRFSATSNFPYGSIQGLCPLTPARGHRPLDPRERCRVPGPRLAITGITICRCISSGLVYVFAFSSFFSLSPTASAAASPQNSAIIYGSSKIFSKKQCAATPASPARIPAIIGFVPPV